VLVVAVVLHLLRDLKDRDRQKGEGIELISSHGH